MVPSLLKQFSEGRRYGRVVPNPTPWQVLNATHGLLCELPMNEVVVSCWGGEDGDYLTTNFTRRYTISDQMDAELFYAMQEWYVDEVCDAMYLEMGLEPEDLDEECTNYHCPGDCGLRGSGYQHDRSIR